MAETLRIVVINGIQALVALHLDGGPGFETATLTTEVWLEIVSSWNLQDMPEDCRRLEVAFKSLAGNVTRWPAPMQLKNHLPARLPTVEPAALRYPPEQAKKNLKRIKALLIDLGAVWESPEQNKRKLAKMRLKGNTRQLLEELAREQANDNG